MVHAPGYSTSPGLAKIGYLMTFCLKNNVKCYIIGQITPFSTILVT